jgi:hypothetical protein
MAASYYETFDKKEMMTSICMRGQVLSIFLLSEWQGHWICMNEIQTICKTREIPKFLRIYLRNVSKRNNKINIALLTPSLNHVFHSAYRLSYVIYTRIHRIDICHCGPRPPFSTTFKIMFFFFAKKWILLKMNGTSSLWHSANLTRLAIFNC